MTEALSDAAVARLKAYCTRATYGAPYYADNGYGRGAAYAARELWRLVWRDTEARDVLLAAGADRNAWRDLSALVDDKHGFVLLDLVSAMERKARAAV